MYSLLKVIISYQDFQPDCRSLESKMKIFVAICVLMTAQWVSGYPQRKKDLDKKVSREGRSDLLQGCTPQQLLDLDQENIACYKRVIITLHLRFIKSFF